MKEINILIGGNGSGKSNFISFFKLLQFVFNQRLQRFVIEENVDNILRFGRKKTELLQCVIKVSIPGGRNYLYHFGLAPTKEGRLYFNFEGVEAEAKQGYGQLHYFEQTETDESGLVTNMQTVI